MECELCGTVLYYIKILLGNNASKEEIKTEIEKLCDQLPTELTSTCKSLVENYLDKVIDMLVKDIDINTICQEIGLCPALTSSSLGTDVVISPLMKPIDTLPLMLPSVGKETENNVQVKEKAGPSMECELCGTVLYYIKVLLGNNASKEEIKTEIEKLCTQLPTELTSECKSLVENYLDKVIDMLVKDIDINTICQEIGLCPALTSSSLGTDVVISPLMKPMDTLPLMLPSVGKETENNVQANAIECEACQEVMKYLNSQLQENKTEEHIKEVLKEVCSRMPSAISGECSKLVDQYTQLIIDYILLSESPDAICKSLRLCAQASVASMKQLPKPVHVKLVKDPQERPLKAGPECMLCEFVLKEIDNLLKGNMSEAAIKSALAKVCSLLPETIAEECDTFAAIKSALAKVCSLLPDTIAQECNNFVNQYAAQIIQLLIQEIDPKQICASIGLCATKEVVVKDVVAAGPICVLCEFVMRELDGMLKGNRNTLSAECTDFVKQYGKLVIQFLVQELDPKEICTKLTLCSGDLIGNFAAKVQIIKDTPKVKNEDLCEVCKLVVGEIKQYIKENHTDAEVEKYLKQLCNILPDTVTAQCHDIVSQYVPAILRLLEENLNETQVCQRAQLRSGRVKWSWTCGHLACRVTRCPKLTTGGQTARPLSKLTLGSSEKYRYDLARHLSSHKTPQRTKGIQMAPNRPPLTDPLLRRPYSAALFSCTNIVCYKKRFAVCVMAIQGADVNPVNLLLFSTRPRKLSNMLRFGPKERHGMNN
ncbi:SAP-like protein [Mya arenaria]|uniref:SAP-like protein n=1 Tax=Mya arenaria TaxID=6604 RepID=A0ABY7DFX1_MYAAR|nr:SAP-like protein [Mya arenaria]